MDWEDDLIVLSEGIVDWCPRITQRVVEIEERLAVASPHETEVAIAYRQGLVAVAHATAPAASGTSLLTCLSLGMTSWANSVMLFLVSSVGTFPTEKLATSRPNPTRWA